MLNSTTQSEIYVLWQVPTQRVGAHPSQRIFLSFLQPDHESAFCVNGAQVISAREQSASVRKEACALYEQISVAVGLYRASPELKTFRSKLRGSQNSSTSAWWYHPLSFRDSEGREELNHLITILTINKVALEYGATKLTLVGGPAEVGAALSKRFLVQTEAEYRSGSRLGVFLRGILSRIRQLFSLAQKRSLARFFNARGAVPKKLSVGLCGFWDWSFALGEFRSQFVDRYFKELPQTLLANRASLCWLAWMDLEHERKDRKIGIKRLLNQIAGRADVLFLEGFVELSFLLATFLDFSDYFIFKNVKKNQDFRQLFVTEKLDFYPVFERTLELGFVGSSIPIFRIMEHAWSKALREHRPKIVLGFLEHFPSSRACAAAAVNEGVDYNVIQHASYNSQKTFLGLNPENEFRGAPDDCPVPTPKRAFVMGSFSQELFLGCGYKTDQIKQVGSSRFAHIAPPVETVDFCLNTESKRLVLICASLSDRVEIDLLKAACLACRDLSTIRLVFRKHPFSRIDETPEFKSLSHGFELSQMSLADDLKRADLILYTYSTTAEEAFVSGKPVWQWYPLTFDGSALAEIEAVPRFQSVSTLRAAIEKFALNPGDWMPDLLSRQRVYNLLFAPSDSQTPLRIAKEVLSDCI